MKLITLPGLFLSEYQLLHHKTAILYIIPIILCAFTRDEHILHEYLATAYVFFALELRNLGPAIRTPITYSVTSID